MPIHSFFTMPPITLMLANPLSYLCTMFICTFGGIANVQMFMCPKRMTVHLSAPHNKLEQQANRTICIYYFNPLLFNFLSHSAMCIKVFYMLSDINNLSRICGQSLNRIAILTKSEAYRTRNAQYIDNQCNKNSSFIY